MHSAEPAQQTPPQTKRQTDAAKLTVVFTFAAPQTHCAKLTTSRSASVIVARSPAHHKPRSSARSGDYSRIELAHLRTVRQSTRDKTPMVLHSVPLSKAFCLACGNFCHANQTHHARLLTFDSMLVPAIKLFAIQTPLTDFDLYTAACPSRFLAGTIAS